MLLPRLSRVEICETDPKTKHSWGQKSSQWMENIQTENMIRVPRSFSCPKLLRTMHLMPARPRQQHNSNSSLIVSRWPRAAGGRSSPLGSCCIGGAAVVASRCVLLLASVWRVLIKVSMSVRPNQPIPSAPLGQLSFPNSTHPNSGGALSAHVNRNNKCRNLRKNLVSWFLHKTCVLAIELGLSADSLP